MASCWRMGCDSGLHGGRGRGAVLLNENEQFWRLGCGQPSHPLQPPIPAPGLEQPLGWLTSCTYHLCPTRLRDATRASLPLMFTDTHIPVGMGRHGGVFMIFPPSVLPREGSEPYILHSQLECVGRQDPFPSLHFIRLTTHLSRLDSRSCQITGCSARPVATAHFCLSQP